MAGTHLRLLTLLLGTVAPAQNLTAVIDLHTGNVGTGSYPRATRVNPHQGTSSRSSFVALGSLVLFVADDEDHGAELWVSDGAPGSGPAGTTHLLLDIRPGTTGSDPQDLFLHGGFVYFTAHDGSLGRNLWRTDGTTAGTQRMNGTAPAITQGGSEFCVLDAQRFLFNATPRGGGNPNLYLWDQGLTTALATAANWCNPAGITALPGGAVFRNQRTAQLNWTDGAQVLNLSTAAGPLQPDKFHRIGSRVVFTARDNPTTTGLELWSTEGTPSNTRALGDLRPGTLPGTNLDTTVEHQGLLYFLGYDQLAGSAIEQLWRTDGTLANTMQVSSQATTPLAGITAMASDGTTLLLGTSSSGIYRSDGTLAGTQLLWASRSVSQLVFTGGAFWWQQASAGGYDSLCRSDGTTVQVLAAPGPGQAAFQGSSGMTGIAPGVVVLAGDDGVRGTELWRTDGTTGNTSLIGDLHSPTWTRSSTPAWFAELTPGVVLFAADDGVHGRELWRSDGTTAGTTLVRDLEPGPLGSGPAWCTPLGNGLVLFAATTTGLGTELWRSDGTAGGTYLLADLDPVSSGSPSWLARVGDRIFFNGTDARGSELWVTDGTTAGTHQVVDVPGGELNPLHLAALGDSNICLFRGTLADDAELWRSDGDPNQTYRVLDLHPSGDSLPSSIVPFGAGALFAATDGVHGRELFWTDGTTAGTWLVEDLYPGAASSNPEWLTTDDFGHAGFVATHPNYGREVWATNGTPQGTSMLAELVSGTGSGDPQGLVFAGNRQLYASVQLSGFGREPFVLGQIVLPPHHRLLDVNPGSGHGIAAATSDDARPFTDTLGRIWLAANDRIHGSEPWVVQQGAWAKAVGRRCRSGPAPRLAAQPPVLGQQWVIEGHDAPLGTFAALGLAMPAILPLPAGPCDDYLTGMLFWLRSWFVPTVPMWTEFVNLPADPALAGLRFSLQSIHSAGFTIDARSNGVWLEAGF